MKCLVLDICFLGSFMITNSISILVIINSDYLFLPDSVLENYVSRNLTISSRLFNLLVCNCS